MTQLSFNCNFVFVPMNFAMYMRIKTKINKNKEILDSNCTPQLLFGGQRHTDWSLLICSLGVTLSKEIFLVQILSMESDLLSTAWNFLAYNMNLSTLSVQFPFEYFLLIWHNVSQTHVNLTQKVMIWENRTAAVNVIDCKPQHLSFLEFIIYQKLLHPIWRLRVYNPHSLGHKVTALTFDGELYSCHWHSGAGHLEWSTDVSEACYQLTEIEIMCVFFICISIFITEWRH